MADVRILDVATTPVIEFRRWDITGHQLNRNLVSTALTGTQEAVVDYIEFPPEFIHHMHRHSNADQMMYVIEGSVRFFGDPENMEHGEDLHAGQFLVVPRDNWHEVHNVTDGICRVLHIFSGLGSLENLEIEHYAPQPAE